MSSNFKILHTSVKKPVGRLINGLISLGDAVSFSRLSFPYGILFWPWDGILALYLVFFVL